MPNELDMDAPVTRREMYEALDTWAGAIIARLTDVLDARFSAWSGSLTSEVRELVRELVKASEHRIDARLSEVAKASEQRISEVRALVKTSEQNILDRMDTLLEPYAPVARVEYLERQKLPERMDELDELHLPARVSSIEAQALPERVSKLEAKVFAPKRRRTKAARRTRS